MVPTVTLVSGRHRVNTWVVAMAMLHSCSHLGATRDIRSTWKKERVWVAVVERVVEGEEIFWLNKLTNGLTYWPGVTD